MVFQRGKKIFIYVIIIIPSEAQSQGAKTLNTQHVDGLCCLRRPAGGAIQCCTGVWNSLDTEASLVLPGWIPTELSRELSYCIPRRMRSYSHAV